MVLRRGCGWRSCRLDSRSPPSFQFIKVLKKQLCLKCIRVVVVQLFALFKWHVIVGAVVDCRGKATVTDHQMRLSDVCKVDFPEPVPPAIPMIIGDFLFTMFSSICKFYLSREESHLFRWRVIANLSQWEVGLRLRETLRGDAQ